MPGDGSSVRHEVTSDCPLAPELYAKSMAARISAVVAGGSCRGVGEIARMRAGNGVGTLVAGFDESFLHPAEDTISQQRANALSDPAMYQRVMRGRRISGNHVGGRREHSH